MNPAPQFGLTSWLSYGLSFVAILCLMGALLLVLRRFANGGRGRAAPRMRVLESIALGPRQRVLLLRVHDHEILVGATQQQIVSLARWAAAADAQVEQDKSRVEPGLAGSKAQLLQSRRQAAE